MTTLMDILAVLGLAMLAPVAALLEAAAKLLAMGSTICNALTEKLA